MPSYPGTARPQPESGRHSRLIHVVSVAAVLFTVAYLAWRAAFTIDLGFWWVAVPLLALEAHNALGLAMFTVALWDVDAGPTSAPRDTTDLTVAVLIATYDEPAAVLLPTSPPLSRSSRRTRRGCSTTAAGRRSASSQPTSAPAT